MEYLKQIIKSNNIEMGKLKELTKIFEMLGNQQEIKNVFKEVNNFLCDIEGGYSVWGLDFNSKIELFWYKGPQELKEEYVAKKRLLENIGKVKKPINDYAEEGFSIIIPIISREEVVGYFCLHKDSELGDKWLEVYTVVELLTFVLKYYQMIEMMKEMSVVDFITGLYNYRHFRLQIDLDVEKAKRFKKPLTLVAFKIKDFDEINKKLGFEGGEQILKGFGAVLSKQSRKTDMPSRISDELFCVLLYETNEEGAKCYIDRINRFLREVPMTAGDYQFNIEVQHNCVEYKKNMSSEEFLERVKKI